MSGEWEDERWRAVLADIAGWDRWHPQQQYYDQELKLLPKDPKPLVRKLGAHLFRAWSRSWPPCALDRLGADGFGLAVRWAAEQVWLIEHIQREEAQAAVNQAAFQNPRLQAFMKQIVREYNGLPELERTRDARRNLFRGAVAVMEPPQATSGRGRGRPKQPIRHVGWALLVEFLSKNDLPAPVEPGGVLRLRKSRSRRGDRPYTTALDAVALAVDLYQSTWDQEEFGRRVRPYVRHSNEEIASSRSLYYRNTPFFYAARLLAVTPGLEAVKGIAEEAGREGKSISDSLWNMPPGTTLPDTDMMPGMTRGLVVARWRASEWSRLGPEAAERIRSKMVSRKKCDEKRNTKGDENPSKIGTLGNILNKVNKYRRHIATPEK